MGSIGDVSSIGVLMALPIMERGLGLVRVEDALAGIRGPAAVQEYSRLLEQNIDGQNTNVLHLAGTMLGRLQDASATPVLVNAVNAHQARLDLEPLRAVVSALGASRAWRPAGEM